MKVAESSPGTEFSLCLLALKLRCYKLWNNLQSTKLTEIFFLVIETFNLKVFFSTLLKYG